MKEISQNFEQYFDSAGFIDYVTACFWTRLPPSVHDKASVVLAVVEDGVRALLAVQQHLGHVSMQGHVQVGTNTRWTKERLRITASRPASDKPGIQLNYSDYTVYVRAELTFTFHSVEGILPNPHDLPLRYGKA